MPTFAEAGAARVTTSTPGSACSRPPARRADGRRLQREIVAGLKSPDLLERFEAVGAEPVGSTPEQFVERIRSDAAKWAEVIKTANVKAQ